MMTRLTPLVVVAAILAACNQAGATGTTASAESTVPGATTSTSVPPDTTSTSVPPDTTSTVLAPSSTLLPDPGRVEIVGEQFHLGGAVTNSGGAAEGLLLNSRMVQAIIDITGESAPFVYPDTGTWDPERNVAEFIAALPAYAAAGLDAVTINLQGGNPLDAPVDDKPEWRISAYESDGSLDPAWMDRLDRVLRAADDEGMAVIVGLFYFGQDHRLDDEAAVVAAVDNVVDWLVAGGYQNVLIEICNECNVNYDHGILQPDRVVELIERVRDRSEGTLPVSASLTGGNIPNAAWITASDFVLLHGNRQDAASVSAMVAEVRESEAFQTGPKPIVFNEDSTNLANLEAAVEAGAGWGYHDKLGFQVPPVSWGIDTETKQAFFAAVAALEGAAEPG
ncbi:MAG: hypothetical protein ACRDVD_08285 [Acidimicrobiia bacterium]